MAKKRRHHGKSVLTKDQFHLNRHDEEKVLLFTSGILFGVGLSAAIISNMYWFSSLALAAIGIVLFMIEYKQD